MTWLIAASTGLFLAGANSSLILACKDYRSCREAVVAWCNGSHPGADGDGDGIPCENVCKSKAEVDRIKKEIGCKR